MSKQVAWTKFIYETFCEEAMLSETERFIMRTRIKGWPVTKQAIAQLKSMVYRVTLSSTGH